MRSDLFKIPPLIRPGQEGFSGSFCNVTRCLTAHQWWRESELGSQQAAEGQPNVSCRPWLVNIPGERCKGPLTQPRPGAHRAAAPQMRPGLRSEAAESPTDLITPTKKSFSFGIHMPLRAQCLPIDSLSVSPIWLWSWWVDEHELMLLFGRPRFTFDHKFQNFCYKCSRYQTGTF